MTSGFVNSIASNAIAALLSLPVLFAAGHEGGQSIHGPRAIPVIESRQGGGEEWAGDAVFIPTTTETAAVSGETTSLPSPIDNTLAASAALPANRAVLPSAGSSGAVTLKPRSPHVSAPVRPDAATTTVSFQQGTNGYAGAVDTYLQAGLPDTDNSTATTLIVDGPTTGAPGDERQILLRFDGLFASAGGPIPDGAAIQSATLTVNITNPSVDGAELHRMLRAWSDADTWNTLGAGVQRDDAEAVATADVTGAYNGTVPSLYTIDVTASLSAWSTGSVNRGWVFVTPGTGSDSWRFDSSEGATLANRPNLTVTYYTDRPPAAPANPSPADGATGVSVNPSLCADVSDPDSATVDVRWYGREMGGATGQDFTIVVLPDPQILSRDRPDIFDAQMDWVVAHRAARNIVFVTSVGDNVDDGSSATQWNNAESALARLENPTTTGLPDGIPYGIAVGNHDQSPFGTTRSGGDETATTLIYNQKFGRARFQGRSYYGGAYDFGDPERYGDNRDNHYELFSASGMDFIVLHLEADFTASAERDAVLNWADNLLQSYGDRRAIVVVHYLIDPNAAWSNQGDAVYQRFKDNPNVFLMLSGHLDTAARRSDTYQTSTIHTVLQDYQAHGSVPDGWLRLYTFQPQSSTIHVQTYSPIQDTYQTDSANDFTLPYTMVSGAPFTSLGDVTGAPVPSRQCTPWPGREGGKTYEWYATVADGNSTTTGPRWTFTVSCVLDGDCDDGDICTTDTCDGGTCQYAPVLGCCTTSAQCEDADLCTVDSCNATTNLCVHQPLNCDDANACTTDSCGAGVCSHEYAPTAGCCESAAQCDDGNLCTTDACDIVLPATTGDCTNTPNAACCATDTDCNDGDPCTTDLCRTTNNSSLILDGVDDHITMGAAPGLGAATFTLEAWVKWAGDGTGADTGTGGLTGAIPIVTKGRAEAEATTQDLNYFLGIEGGKLAADFEEAPGICVGGPTPGAACSWTCSNSGSACSLDSQCSGGTCTVNNCGTGGICDGYPGLNHPVRGTTAVPVGAWTHVAATYDGSCWQLFLNGVAETPGATCPGRAPRSDSIQHFAVGTAMNSGGVAAGRFHGRVDEVRVWNLARTQADIQASMHATASGTGLIGRFSLDEGTGTIAHDATATHSDGTVVGAAVWDLADKADVGPNTCQNTPLSCDDGNFCTADLCSGGVCNHEPANDGLACDDGSGCTYDDLCAAGVCAGTLSCDDGNACTTDACDGTACTHTYSPSPGCCTTNADCNDGNPGTMDTCTLGDCTNTPNATCTTNSECNDADPCTTDLCQPDPFSLEFEGTNDYITMGAAPGLNAATFTLECWFKWTGGGTVASTGASGIYAVPLVTKGLHEADGSNVDANYFLGIQQTTNVLAADFEEGATGATPGLNHPVVGTTPVTPNVWHHAAVTYDGSCWQLYLDGQPDTNGTNCPGQPPRSDSIQHFGVGVAMNSTGVTEGRFAGLMDEVRVWNRPLTQSEIQANMNTPVSAGTGLIGRWGLDEGAGAIAHDSSSTGASGTIAGGAAWREEHAPLGTGTCEHTPANEGGACDDANVCTTGTTCASGVCGGGSSVNCDDGSICTADSCDPASGCQHAPANEGADCSDLCQTGATCSGGVCSGGSPIRCDDGNVCTDDSCNPTSGCVHANNTAPCDDGSVCTTVDACSGGACVGGSPLNCGDGNACTLDSCDPVAGCIHTAIPGCCVADTDCGDGNACTTDYCRPADPNQGAGGPWALSFDGANDYVDMGQAPGLGAARFTIETWFKRTGPGVGNTTGSGGIASLVPLVTKGAPEADGSNVDGNYMLGINTAGNVLAADFEQFGTCTGGTGSCATAPYGPGCDCTLAGDCQSGVCSNAGLNHPISGVTPIVNDTWYHAAATYDGTMWRLYLNGNLDATLVVGAVRPRYDSIQRAALGTMQKSAGGATPQQVGFFAGVLDEARIWNYSRTQAEIQAGMDREIVSAAGLLGRWGLNEGSGLMAHDSTGGEDGTLTSGPVWTTGRDFGAANTCGHQSLAGCCNTNEECADADVCTADSCIDNACQHAPIPGCCTSSAQCADGDSCTTDACVDNTCTYTPIPGCGPCTTDAQCDDLNSCTQNTCNTRTKNGLQFASASSQYATMGAASGLGVSQFTLEAWVKQNPSGGTWGTTASTGTGGLTAAVPVVTKGRGEADGNNKDCNYFMGISGGKLAADFEEGLGTCSGGSTPGDSCTWRCSNNTATICSVDSQCTSPGTCTANTCGGGGTCVGKAGLNHPVTGATTLSTTDWVHVAATYDGTTWRLYVNGALDATSAVGAFLPRADSIQHFGIATAMDSAGARQGFLNASVDEVRVWNRALAQAEIQANKNREILGAPGLIGRWGLNEGVGSVVNDSTSPAENGTLAGSPLPVWISTGLPSIGTDTCEYPALANGTACNDGSLCTQTDSCQGGACIGTNPVTCTAPDQCHDAGVCDPGTGVCSNPEKQDGSTCDDGNPCTSGDMCSGGACGGTPLPLATEVQDLNLADTEPSTTLAWTGQDASMAYDVASGLVSELSRDDGMSAATCVGNDVTGTAYIDTRSAPLAGDGYYYVVRAQGLCSTGTYGYATSGVERLPAAACP